MCCSLYASFYGIPAVGVASRAKSYLVCQIDHIIASCDNCRMTNVFPHPFTSNTLPAHKTAGLTLEQRKALPDMVVQKDKPAQGFVTLDQFDSNQQGKFLLYPERMNGDDPMTEIKFTLGLGDLNFKDVMNATKDDTLTPEEVARRWQMLSGVEMGSVWSQELAIELLGLLREEVFDEDTSTQLTNAGFASGNVSNLYRKTEGKGDFLLRVGDTGCWLMYHPKNQDYWHNILILHSKTQWQDGNHFSPIFWPDTVVDPQKAIAGLAVRASQMWSPQFLPQARDKRKPQGI